MTFGERIRQLREERGLSRDDFRLMVGKISYNTVVGYENDITRPSLRKLGKICKVFGMTPSELLDGVEL